MIGRITWTDYTTDSQKGTLVRLGVRMADDSKKNLYVEGTEPYIFVPDNERIPNEDYIVRTEEGYESLFDQKLKKVVTETPKQAGGLTDNFSWTGEADLPYYRRVAVHDGLSGYIDVPEDAEGFIHIDEIETDVDSDEVIEPRICISDIEVHIGDETFEETRENGSQPINVICCYDSYEQDFTVFYYDKYERPSGSEIRSKLQGQLKETGIEDYSDSRIELVISDTESEMLKSYTEYISERNFDLTTGWNWIDFDWNYLIQRMKTLQDQGKDIHWSWLSPFNVSSSSRNDQMQVCGLPAFDMMKAFCDKLTFSNWRSKSLEYVSNEELGIGKIDDVDINEDWKNNPSKLIAYNIVDVILTVALDDKNDIHGFFYEMADACSIPVYDAFYEKRMVDGIVLSMRNDKEILPTADESELVDNAGGFVADPFNGIKTNVGVSDLKSLYPSAIITWNLSTETVAETPEEFDEYVAIPKVPEPKDVEGEIDGGLIDWDWLYASLDREGIIPKTTKTLFNKRNREKQKMYEAEDGSPEEQKWNRKQGATKVIMNSIYGNLSSKYYRLSNEYLGDSVTSTARYTLWKGKQTLDRIGYEHLYSDTDSHFLKLTGDTIEERIEELKCVSEEMDKDASEIFKDIYYPPDSCKKCNADIMYDSSKEEYYCPNHGFREELPKHPFLKDADLHGDEYTCMKWEPEKNYSRLLQLNRKKRYAGNIEWKEGTTYKEPKMDISGFENQRSDSPPVTAELQEEVLRMILTGSEFEEVSNYIQSIIDKIDRDNDNVNQFALPGSINKDLEDYPNRQVPRASMYSNEYLDYEFGEGDSPFVYLVDETPPELPNTDVVAFEWDEEIPEGFELDKEAIIERAVKKPIDSIINEMGWTFDELRSGKKTQSMDFGSGGNPFS
jgi:DNA polymerase elongation subunit (family B)